MPVISVVITVYIVTVCMVFFTFFTAKIAEMKLRRPSWGILGALLGPVGLLAVSYLPSRRKDGKETNLIRSGIRALPSISRKALVVLGILLLLVLVAVQLITYIPKWQENRQYEKSIGSAVTEGLTYTSTVKGKPIEVVAGADSTFVVTDDGDLYGWGYNHLNLQQQDKGELMGEVVSVAQLGRDVYVLKKDNKLYKSGQDGQWTEFAANVTKVDCGPDYGALIKSNGDVYVWGSNAYGQLGSAGGAASEEPLWLCSTAADIACGGRHLLVLKQNGDVFACGDNTVGALGLTGETGAVSLRQIAADCKAIAAGTDFSLILTKSGTVKSCGANGCGQLGRTLDEEKEETEEIYLTFSEVATDADAIGAGGKSGWYLSEGKLYTWGQNHCGQLGQGGTKNTAAPTEIMDKVTAVSASADHLVIISSDKLYVCGDNSYGQLGKPGDAHLTPKDVVAVRG